MEQIIYLIGGPADLTKLAVSEIPEVVMMPVETELRSEAFDVNKEPEPIEAVIAKYVPKCRTEYGYIFEYQPE